MAKSILMVATVICAAAGLHAFEIILPNVSQSRVAVNDEVQTLDDQGYLVYLDGNSNLRVNFNGIKDDQPIAYQLIDADGEVVDSGFGCQVSVDNRDCVAVLISLGDSANNAQSNETASPQSSAMMAIDGEEQNVEGEAATPRTAANSVARAAAAGVDEIAYEDLGSYTIKVEYGPTTDNFSILGVSPPSGTVTRNDFTYSASSAGHTNSFDMTAKGGIFKALKTGWYTFQIAADDFATVTLGKHEVSARWPNKTPGEAVRFFMRENETLPVAVEAGSVGGPAQLAKVKWGEYEPYSGTPPVLTVDPAVIEFDLSSVGDSERAIAEYTCDSLLADNYELDFESPAAGLSVSIEDGRGLAIPDLQSSWWMSNDTASVEFVLRENGDECARATAVFKLLRAKAADECDECASGCSEGTVSANGCVAFAQRFGRTPQFGAMPVGAIRIDESRPLPRLWTGGSVYYDHPMMRRVIFRGTGEHEADAIIRSPDGAMVEYRAGLPVNAARGRDSSLTVNAMRRIVEKLPDRMRIEYDEAGAVAAIAPPDGIWVPVEELGIAVNFDAYGRLVSVESRADGTMALSRSANSFSLQWTDTRGEAVKTFAFTGNGIDEITLTETRPGGLSGYTTRWNYQPEIQDWTMTKAVGTADEISESRAVVWDATNRTYAVSVRQTSASGEIAVETTMQLDFQHGAGAVTGSTIGEKSTFQAVRDAQTGKLSASTDARGSTRTYTYDRFGRTLTATGPVFDGQTETVVYEYATNDVLYGDVERRPLSKKVFRNGIEISSIETRYESNRVTRILRAGESERTSFYEFDAYGRRTLTVREDARATLAEYSLPNDGGWTHTTTEGVWNNDAFATIDRKSTRTIENFDLSGNCLATTREAFIDGAWHEFDWITNRYDATHRVIYSRQANGLETSAAWMCSGPIWQRFEDGITVSNRYDGVKRLAAAIRYSPHGELATEYHYDAAGRTIGEYVYDGHGHTNATLNTYDIRGRIVAETDAAGFITATDYSDDDLITTVTYPDGGTRITAVNADGSIASITGSAVVGEFYTYGVASNGLEWTCVRYGRADSPRYEKTYRNGFGETVRIERPSFGGATLVTENTYDDKGRLVATTETGKPVVIYAYDDWGDLVSTTHSADSVSRIVEESQDYALLDGEVWRSSMQTISTSDATIAPIVTEAWTKVSGLTLDHIAESFTVDVRGNTNRTWSAQDPVGAKRTTWSQQAGVGNVSFVEVVDGVTIRTVDATCVTNTVVCDAFRRETARTDGRGNTITYAYDALGRLVAETDAATNTTAYAYDSMGYVIAVTNALGNVTRYEYDLRGNKIFAGGATYPVCYTYDVYGNKASMTTYRDFIGESGSAAVQGDVTRWLYDEATGLVTNKIYADGKGPSYMYTDDGKLAARTWARGVTTSYTYDAWENLVSTTYSDGTPSVTFAYDALGRRTSVTDAKGTTVFSYDAFGDVSRETTTGLYSKTLIRHRDAYRRDLGHTMDGSRKNIIEYDSATGRIKREKLGGAWFTWTYLPGSHLKSRLTYGSSGYTDWAYEPHRDLPTQVRNYVYGNVISQYDYVYDAHGRRTATTRSGTMMSETRSDAYGYNDRSELIYSRKGAESAEDHAYQYDDIGNRLLSFDLGTNRTYTANALNQYTQISNLCDSASLCEEFLPQYDDDGNQILIKTETGVWQVTYNGENRPIHWTNLSNISNHISQSFDYMGRRVEYLETTVNEDSVVTNKHQYFVYDGYLCLQIINAQTGVAEYAFEWDPTEPVATRPMVMQRTGGWNLFYTHDGNKNVSELVYYQRARGVAAHYEYAPFGAVVAKTRGDNWGTLDFASLNPFRFSSEYADDATATVYYNYRHYEPTIGRWTTRDSDAVYSLGGIYSFLNEDPINHIDLIGLAKWGNFQALLHYFFGRGRDVALHETGWADQIKERIRPHRKIWSGVVLDRLKGEMSRFDCNSSDVKTIILRSPVGINSGVFWIGGFSLFQHAKCTLAAKQVYGGCCVSGECDIWYLMNDRFEDPSDFDNSKGSDFWDHWTYGGTPFSVYSIWHDPQIKMTLRR